jgi:hypothetical protein
MSDCTSSSGTVLPVKENSPSSGVSLEEEDLGDLLLAAVLGHHEVARLVRADEGLDHGGEIEELEVPLELLRPPRQLQRRRLQPPRQHPAEAAGERGKAGHEVQEDGLLQREQHRVLRRADGRRPRRARQQGQLAEDLAGAEVGDRHGGFASFGSGEDLQNARLHDVEAVALLSLPEHHRPGTELLETALGQDRFQYFVRLALEEVGGAEEGGVDGRGHGSAIIQCVKMAAFGARNPPYRAVPVP